MKKVNNSIGSSKIKHCIVLSLVLMAFWLLLSGKTEIKYLSMGVATVLVTVWATLPLLRIPSEDGKKYFYAFDFPFIKYALYWIYLSKEIAKASIDVAKIVLDPKLPINPQVVQFKRPMDNPLAHVTLANSITLTPGTITMDIDNGVYTIHALSDGAAEGLENGQAEMMQRVSAVFGENQEGSYKERGHVK
ncbi:MAG: Na+/H+ antiporter subunit E [Clostridia bacterium]|nr:Na+/H+ antiporter subunit E [Clostridia bacterium]